jgi:hypothetical protein
VRGGEVCIREFWRKKPPQRPSKLDPFKPVIDKFLRADLDAPRRRRSSVRGKKK